MSKVKLLARWNGWCDPCETERPLLLTETGELGLRAWLRGVGPEDRSLLLTCAVCGEWQDVPFDEEDDPVVVVAASAAVAVQPLGVRQVVVRLAAVPYPADPIPSPRRASARAGVAGYRRSQQDVLELLSEGLDLLTAAG